MLIAAPVDALGGLTIFGIGKTPDYQVTFIPATPAISLAVAETSAIALMFRPISELSLIKPSGLMLPLERDQSLLARTPARSTLAFGPSSLKSFFLEACRQLHEH